MTLIERLEAAERCHGHIWAAPRFSVVPPLYRKDGMALTHPNVKCKFCGVNYDDLDLRARAALRAREVGND